MRAHHSIDGRRERRVRGQEGGTETNVRCRIERRENPDRHRRERRNCRCRELSDKKQKEGWKKYRHQQIRASRMTANKKMLLLSVCLSLSFSRSALCATPLLLTCDQFFEHFPVWLHDDESSVKNERIHIDDTEMTAQKDGVHILSHMHIHTKGEEKKSSEPAAERTHRKYHSPYLHRAMQ